MRPARMRMGAAIAVALVLTACAPDAPRSEVDGSAATGASDPESAGMASDQPVLDPAYAVKRPGPRTDALASADILIFGRDTLSADVVEAVSGLAGVTATTTLSLANVSLENKVYNIAAVDPASYRRFTEAASADFQEQWARVAGGELAVSPTLRTVLPVDADGFLDVGQRLHVGAWAPQVLRVDMVVNAKRGEALGMVPGNALLLSTGSTAPQELERPLERVIGTSVSVQNLDAVARYGLDPNAFQTAVLVGSFADAVGVFNYTPIGGGRIAPDPSWVSAHITSDVVPILGSVTCNVDLMPQLKAALAEVVQQGLADKIHPGEYAGCYYPRFIAGSSTLSNHSFGLALDLNVPGNLRGTVGEIDRGVVAIFKRWGFAWGGDWRYTDPMHFELSRIVRPG